MTFQEIEKIILSDDQRGMSLLYENINKGFIKRSTDLVLGTYSSGFIALIGIFFLRFLVKETLVKKTKK